MLTNGGMGDTPCALVTMLDSQTISLAQHFPVATLARPVCVVLSQERIASEIIEMFVGAILPEDVPALEDLLGSQPLCAYAEWIRDHDRDITHLVPPDYTAKKSAQWEGVMAGRQTGVLNARGAIDPLVDVKDCKDEHLRRACKLAVDSFMPWSKADVLDDDLHFAIKTTVTNRRRRVFRQQTCAAFQVLKERMAPLTRKLLALQPHSVKTVAGQLDVGLICAMAVAMKWRDKGLAKDFILGFPIIGKLL